MNDFKTVMEDTRLKLEKEKKDKQELIERFKNVFDLPVLKKLGIIWKHSYSRNGYGEYGRVSFNLKEYLFTETFLQVLIKEADWKPTVKISYSWFRKRKKKMIIPHPIVRKLRGLDLKYIHPDKFSNPIEFIELMERCIYLFKKE